jgi:Zinc finger C-x8-C-x5-C-x3-H type (and similar)/RNA-binding, Nab2-type zinc finger
MASPCKYFAYGGCKRGASCVYSHGNPPTNNPFLGAPELRAEVASFTPSAPVLQPPSIQPPESFHGNRRLPCSFFLRVACKNGYLCKFLHEKAIKEQTISTISNAAQPNPISRHTTVDEVTLQVSKDITSQMWLISGSTAERQTRFEPGDSCPKRGRRIIQRW